METGQDPLVLRLAHLKGAGADQRRILLRVTARSG